MTYDNILIIGGSGFIGSQVAAQLARAGQGRITVVSRRAERCRHLLVLPTVRTVSADVHDPAVLEHLCAQADVVVNLVGTLHSRRGPAGSAYGPEFERVHVELPRKIASACMRAGIRRYVHMSALGASRHGTSMYLRSKAAGEIAARSQPEVAVTVLRPAVVFGEHDRFLNLFAQMQKYLPLVLLGAAEARFQPIYVGDVAQAVASVLQRPGTAGKTYELVGPHIYTLRQLVQLAGMYAGHPRPVIGLPPWLATLQAACLEYLPGRLLTRDNLASMQVDNIATEPPALELGIAPVALEQIVPRYLAGVDMQEQFAAYRRNARR